MHLQNSDFCGMMTWSHRTNSIIITKSKILHKTYSYLIFLNHLFLTLELVSLNVYTHCSSYEIDHAVASSFDQIFVLEYFIHRWTVFNNGCAKIINLAKCRHHVGLFNHEANFCKLLQKPNTCSYWKPVIDIDIFYFGTL